jgi:ribosomal protein S18 acetylase RimI-like enzyme
MSIRKIQLPNDLDILYQLIIDSFQYPENPEWNIDKDEVEGIKDTVATFKRIWPLYRLISWTSPALRDALLGFLWEEDRKPVGLVTIARRGNTDTWLVGNVAVLPDFRRRGIARKLVNTGLNFIREQGGTLAVLDVIDGNLPAYQLYKSLGFEHYTSTMDLFLTSDEVPHLPEAPSGYQIKKITLRDWQIEMEMAKQTVPVYVQAFDPITEARFKKSVLMRFFLNVLSRSQGVRICDFALRNSQTDQIAALGFIAARTRSGGRHSIGLSLPPEKADLVPFLVQYMLHKVNQFSPEHTIESVLWEWRYFAIEEFNKAGFEKRKEGHRLGIIL